MEKQLLCSSVWNALKYHGNLESSTTRAQHVAQRYPAVLQDDVSGGRAFDAQLVFLLPQRKPGVRHGDQERTDTLQIQEIKEIKSTIDQFTLYLFGLSINMCCVIPCVWASCLWWRTQRWQRHPSCWWSKLWFHSAPTHLPPDKLLWRLHLHHCRYLQL